ncbi:tripartite motif-containing protein 16-like, partial [Clarias magur]
MANSYMCCLCADELRDPVTIPCGDEFCLECIKIYWDQLDHQGVYSCPECRATFTPRPVLRCLNVPTVSSRERHSPSTAKVLVVTQSEVQHVIQERMKELQDLRHHVDVLKGSAHRAQEASDKIFSEMLHSVERWHAEICQLIQANLQVAMAQADSYLVRLEQEIMELQQRDAELRHVLDTEDSIYFLQTFPLMCIAPEPMVPKVLINQEFSFNDVTKTVTDMKEYLDDICKKQLDNLSKKVSDMPVYTLNPRAGARFKDSVSFTPLKADLQEPKSRADFLRYTVRLTFDPNTAYKELLLSNGSRRVVRKRLIIQNALTAFA